MRRGDAPPEDADGYLAEAHATYATGLLAIALTVDEFADEAVRSGTICSLARYLRRSVLGATGADPEPHQIASSPSRAQASPAISGKASSAASSSPQLIRTEAALAARAPAEASAAAAASESAGAAAGASEGIDLGRQAEMLRGMREWYALQGIACLGEYLECMAPVVEVSRSPPCP